MLEPTQLFNCVIILQHVIGYEYEYSYTTIWLYKETQCSLFNSVTSPPPLEELVPSEVTAVLLEDVLALSVSTCQIASGNL